MGWSKDLLYTPRRLSEIAQSFAQELTDAQKGKQTNLRFIKNPLPPHALVQNNQQYQVITIGGSKLKTALVTKKGKGLVMGKTQVFSLPILQTKEIFFSCLSDHMTLDAPVISLNFAYALSPVLRDSLLDGNLLSPSKEHTLDGLIGKTVGKELEIFIKKTYNKTMHVTVANDTVCLIMAGLEKAPAATIVGCVIGTGVNAGFFLDNYMVVNLEAANFDKFPQTETGKIIDTASTKQGTALFEKEVSGAYLYQHYNKLIKVLNIAVPPITETKTLSYLSRRGNTQQKELARILLERSASLAASMLAGIYFFKQQPKLTCIMEGSVFWKGWQYEETVRQYLEELGVGEKNMSFVKITHSDLLGGAKLASL